MIGLAGNVGHDYPPGFAVVGGPYRLAVCEFDDQGEPFDPSQITAVRDTLATEADAIVLVFVHGWRNNADLDNDNLREFRTLLSHVAGIGDARPVYGVFVAWRGLSWRGGLPEILSFWGRQRAARRVSNGSVRELFAYLHRYRKRRIKAGGAPMLAIAGHSFGGLIVYSALEQSLIEAATRPEDHIVPGFADLVLLVNPAFEASRYLPIDRLAAAFKTRNLVQVPIFVCVSAVNDLATGLAFPVGNYVSLTFQSVRDGLQRACRRRTLGNVPALATHTIRAGRTSPFVLKDLSIARSADNAIRQPNPFWVVRASRRVVDGHGGIWGDIFMDFLRQLLWAKVQTTARGSSGAARSAASIPPRFD